MDRRILRYTERELQYLREMGAEFAREFPVVAGRLALDVVPCPDPYVERLLEGFAFLAARVHLKLDAEFPRFTQSLLETVYPHYLGPTPSMCVLQFQPRLDDPALAEGSPIPRGSKVRSVLGRGEQTACEYRTAHDISLWPVRLTEAGYFTRDLASLEIPAQDLAGAKAGIRLRFECTAGLTFDKIALDDLTLYLKGSGDTQSRLYEQCLAHGRRVVIQPVRRPAPWRHALPASSIRQVGFGDEHALLPVTARSFQGYRLLHEYFALPDRFFFIQLAGLRGGLKRCIESHVDVVILLNQADLALENAVTAESFLLGCTPAINLFPKRADRIQISDRFSEFQVIPDRTRPRDYEVYQVLSVTGHGARAEQQQDFSPFYAARDFGPDEKQGAYFTVQRVPRVASEKEQRQGKRSSYAGGETYLSIVDAKAAPYRPDLRELSIETLCTNRDLPLFVAVGRGPTDFTIDFGAPVDVVKCVSGVPTQPRASHAEGELAWRAISHLSLNYLSLADSDQRQGAAGLRDLLRLYGDATDPATRRQIEGVRSVQTKPLTRRVVAPGPIAFARGLEVTVTFDDLMFEGRGVFLLGAVLDQFFAKYVSINSFTETVIRSPDRGEVMRWPARIGKRQIL